MYFCNASFRRKPSGGCGRCRYRDGVYKRSFFVFQNFATFVPSENNATKRPPDMSLSERPCRLRQGEAGGFAVHISVGFLRCSFSKGGHCEGLKHGTGKSKDSHAFSLCFFSHATIQSVPSGVRARLRVTQNDDSRRTTHRMRPPRAGTDRYLVRSAVVLYPPQCLQDFPEREYRYPVALAYLLYSEA